MLGFQEPLDCRTSFCGVLDLRTRVETEERRAAEITGKWDGRNSPIDDRMPSPHPSDGRLPPSPHPSDGRLPPSPGEMSVLTPPRDVSLSPPIVDVVSPSLAIAQRVLAAATAPQGVRPFKAYPKDPVALSPHSDAYLQFRQHMLTQVRGSKSCLIKKRPASPVSPHSPLNQQQQPPQHSQLPTSSGHDSSDDKDKDKDAAYWERRRKNNEAAKRSRDARRAKEDEIAIRAAFLEQENLRLKYQVAALTDETAKLRCLLYKAEGRCLTTGSTAGMTMT